MKKNIPFDNILKENQKKYNYVKKVSIFINKILILQKITTMSQVLSEIIDLNSEDCFFVVERHKSEFTYPLHQHQEFEINFIQNGKGVRRIVGDSVESIDDYELTIIASPNLEHVWEQGDCTSKDIREITIQFSSNLFDSSLFRKRQFAKIAEMFDKAQRGLNFPLPAIMNAYIVLDNIAKEKNSFRQFILFLELIYILSLYEGRQLASSSFAHAEMERESRRILKVKDHINENYTKELKLEELSNIVGMSPSSFSRFFKTNTGTTISDYITNTRLGHASRFLVDTNMNISEICYSCGFNNLSNFNRIFKAKRGISPREFREIYKKKKVKI